MLCNTFNSMSSSVARVAHACFCHSADCKIQWQYFQWETCWLAICKNWPILQGYTRMRAGLDLLAKLSWNAKTFAFYMRVSSWHPFFVELGCPAKWDCLSVCFVILRRDSISFVQLLRGMLARVYITREDNRSHSSLWCFADFSNIELVIHVNIDFSL